MTDPTASDLMHVLAGDRRATGSCPMCGTSISQWLPSIRWIEMRACPNCRGTMVVIAKDLTGLYND